MNIFPQLYEQQHINDQTECSMQFSIRLYVVYSSFYQLRIFKTNEG